MLSISILTIREMPIGEDMRLPQIYESTVLDPYDAKKSWRFLVVPARSIQEADQRIGLSVIERLYLRQVSSVTVSHLPFLFAAMRDLSTVEVHPNRIEEVLYRARSYARTEADAYVRPPYSPEEERERQSVKFAEQLIFRPLVPFERSPLAQESLASIVATAADEEDADTMLVDSEGSPLLTIVSPDGIVITGPQQNFSLGLWDRILQWLQGG
jgi:hypothetical protein